MLDHLNVLDFTVGYCGAFAAMTLGNQGAKVRKIEIHGRPDPLKKVGISLEGTTSRFIAYNGNKELVSLGLENQEEYKKLEEFIQKADVIIENFEEQNFGITYEWAKKLNPTIIFAHISGYGAESDNRHPYSLETLQAETGLMDMTGFATGEPTKAGGHVIENFCGISLSVAITAAYYSRCIHNVGDYIDFSLYHTVFSLMESPILFQTMLGKDVSRCGNGDPATLVPYDSFPCKDGHFTAGLASDAGWDRFCNAIEMPELIEDERFLTNELRCEKYDLLTSIISTFFQERTKAELTEIFNSFQIPCGAVLTVEEIMEHPQVRDRNMILSKGALKILGNPIKTN